jgi:hypothetical protein
MSSKESPEDARKRKRALVVGVVEGGDLDAAIARKLTRPEVVAAATIQTFDQDSHDVNALVRELSEQTRTVVRGDLSRAEGMLIAQAHTLDQLFGFLARRAHLNLNEYPDAAEKYLRLAFKAQSQCRATLESLGALKNPPVVYARQANIAHGPQQVNNGPVHARETESPLNEQSEATNELLPDTRASQAARRVDPPMEAVGTVYRAEDGGGEGP